MKKYVKPQLVAKSAPQRSFVAGCPVNRSTGTHVSCRKCEVNQ